LADDLSRYEPDPLLFESFLSVFSGAGPDTPSGSGLGGVVERVTALDFLRLKHDIPACIPTISNSSLRLFEKAV
jgi:hypothetical protein